jgi:hypothetical protein
LYPVAAISFIRRSDGLVSVIEECDKAISYAINSRSGTKESEESGHKFEEAIRYLSDYESKFHHRYINIINDVKYCIADSLVELEVGRKLQKR